MIVTVTLNPLLERRYSFKKFQYHGINRDGNLILAAGGKGINVSRQLNQLSIQNLAFIPLGGTNGKIIRNILKEERINFTSINIKSETREGVVIIDEKNETVVSSLFEKDHEITDDEAGIFKEKLEKIIQNCEIIIFSGSSPCVAADSIFPFGIEIANRYDKVSYCDTYGRHLTDCIKAGPTILHNNLDEITNSLGIKLDCEENILSFLNQLYSNGIKQSYLTNGSEAFYASNFDFHFKIKPPYVKSINPTGSGDSFSAGIIYGWYKDLTFEEALKLGTSLGAANAARFDVCNISLPDSDKFLSRVEVEAIGKKMKLLDVTPR